MTGVRAGAFALALVSCVVSTSALCEGLMTLDFSWRGIVACAGGSRSPAFSVRNAPPGTYRLSLTLSREGDEYGGEQIPYPPRGDVVAGTIYTNGPCQPGDYRWNVVALDRSGRTLAAADRTRVFP
jgi:hypothetical protein